MPEDILRALAQGQRELATPFTLEFPDVGVLGCDAVLRLLPGRRLVAATRFREQRAVLKLFLGDDAERYLRRERRGVERLHAAALPAPELLAECRGAQGERGLLFAWVDGARPLDVASQEDFSAAVAALARAHDAGVWQQDLNLENLVMGTSGVTFVDGDAVRAQRGALGPRRSRENLAKLLAERPPIFDGELPALIDSYQRVRGFTLTRAAGLDADLQAARRRRTRRYLKKTLRDASEFAVLRAGDLRGVRRRDWAPAELDALLNDPDHFLESGERLKTGGNATVARVRLAGGGSLVLKRYNVKSSAHALRRALRSRARRAWLGGHRLAFLGVPTARPLALLEQRGPRAPAFLMLEDLGDGTLGQELAEQGLSAGRLRELVELFTLLDRAGLSHNDTKLSNFLVGPDDRVHLVDVDAVAEGRGRDVERFLANFEEPLRARFAQAFRNAGLR